MGRGNRQQASAQSLLYGRPRRGRGPNDIVQPSVDELIEKLSGGENKNGDNLFTQLGLRVDNCTSDTIPALDGRNLDKKYLKAVHCDMKRGKETLGSLEYWREPATPDSHVFTIEKRPELGIPTTFEKQLFAALANLSDPQEKMVEINIKPFDDFGEGWYKEFKSGRWRISDSELSYPLRNEKTIIDAFASENNLTAPADNLEDIAQNEAGIGYEFLESFARSGQLYVRANLSEFR